MTRMFGLVPGGAGCACACASLIGAVPPAANAAVSVVPPAISILRRLRGFVLSLLCLKSVIVHPSLFAIALVERTEESCRKLSGRRQASCFWRPWDWSNGGAR